LPGRIPHAPLHRAAWRESAQGQYGRVLGKSTETRRMSDTLLGLRWKRLESATEQGHVNTDTGRKAGAGTYAVHFTVCAPWALRAPQGPASRVASILYSPLAATRTE
jgi:hypothetical protein